MSPLIVRNQPSQTSDKDSRNEKEFRKFFEGSKDDPIYRV